MSAQIHPKVIAIAANRFPAAKVELKGRFMLPSRSEHECRIVEMSTGEVTLATSIEPRIGEKIIVYIAELGRFEGEVTRPVANGFVIRMTLPKAKHARLAEQLTCYGNQATLDLPECRKAERVVPTQRRTTLRLFNGKESVVKIVDISCASVSVETSVKPLRESKVVVGARPATVLRLFEGGFVAEFETPFAEGELNEFTKL
jgi:hypothetical protein